MAVERIADRAEQYAAQIRAIFDRAELVILAEVRRRILKGLKTPGWAERKAAEIAEMRQWLRRHTAEFLSEAAPEVRRIVRQAYDEGAAAVAEQLKAANLLDIHPQPFEPGARIRALASDTVTVLASTSRAILRTTLDAYRDVIEAAAGEVVTGVSTRWAATKRALEAFADRGITGFVDEAGRRWDLGSYAEMATRTAVMRSAKEGAVDRYEAAGEDLVIVSDHWEECDLCRPWEGKILSLKGRTPGYPTIDQAEVAGLFHPNCRHTVSLYTPGLTRTPRTQGPESPAEARLIYQERMQQRRLERGIRQWKRREAAALDDEARERAGAKVAEWTRALQAHIRHVNKRREETGSLPARRFPKREIPM